MEKLNIGRASARAAQAQRGEWVGGDEDYCLKIKTAGFGSLNETTTNSDAETTYTMALPPRLPLKVPLPFVGDEDMEYAALAAMPKVGPLAAPISSVP